MTQYKTTARMTSQAQVSKILNLNVSLSTQYFWDVFATMLSRTSSTFRHTILTYSTTFPRWDSHLKATCQCSVPDLTRSAQGVCDIFSHDIDIAATYHPAHAPTADAVPSGYSPGWPRPTRAKVWLHHAYKVRDLGRLVRDCVFV